MLAYALLYRSSSTTSQQRSTLPVTDRGTVFAREHDRAVPEILAALLLGPGVLPQAGSYLVALADVGECSPEALRIIAEQDIDTRSRRLGPS